MSSARFAGQSVIVTGGAAGIGASIVDAFRAEGAHVAAWDIVFPEGAASVVGVTPMVVDISDEDAVRAAVAQVVATQGGVDVLVCNAAAFVFGTVEAASSADWDRSFNVNVKVMRASCFWLGE